ncbi:hypothetical protein N7456_010433 [Penicillium angulare]|uniref:Nephrocystin 3-like N-terminal domain-containing protein n=1 Tax=Penicillium angulare TaxID=116970 RepID=A0A9W9F6M8_9EURO|nr:hypothetical protein N7456_010433 [Penicillium angulare]
MTTENAEVVGHDMVMVDNDDIRDFNEDNVFPLPEKDLMEIKEWLQPTPYDLERSEFARHLASHLLGTGQWLTSTNIYKQWLQGDEDGVVLIKGIPGSGKSVMAASIIDQLRKENVPVLYFFFRQIIAANHQPISALRDWLCQILPFSPPLQAKLKTEYLDKCRSLDSLSPSDLWKDLKFALSKFPKAYCVTDALDEMDQGNDEFIRALVDLGRWKPSNVKVLITSRPVDAIEAPLRPFSVPSIRLEEQIVDNDIATYVQYRLRHSSIPPEHWRIITEAIPGRANGLFLYARLSMDAFVEAGADVHKALQALPDDLNVMYSDLLREHARRSAVPDELQLLVLQFVTHATRPLRLLEISEIVKAVYDSLEVRSLKDTKNLIRAACGPLLEILPDETVSVVHHSFTEFLKGMNSSSDSDKATYPVLQMNSTNHRLATVCLDYLQSGCLEKIKIDSGPGRYASKKKAQKTELSLQFPFLEYAATNWHVHARRAAQGGADLFSVHQRMDNFFGQESAFVAWLAIYWSKPRDDISGITPLHITAQAGLTQYVIYLLDKGDVSVDFTAATGKAPLYYAAVGGHADTAQILLSRGAQPDGIVGESFHRFRPLYAAASRNHADVVKLLLSAGVHPYEPSKRIRETHLKSRISEDIANPLKCVCKNGHLESVNEFFFYLIDTETHHLALSWAAEAGQAKIVQFILQNSSVDVNAKVRGDTPLLSAVESGDQETIETLLRAGADPNTLSDHSPVEDSITMLEQAKRGYTPLHSACLGNGVRKHRRSPPSPECVTALLEAGADTEIKSPDGSTALIYACQSNFQLAKLLLDAGADPTAETNDGKSILHTGDILDPKLLALIIGTDLVDINKVDHNGKTPLHYQSNNFDGTKLVLKFLEYKPNVNIRDKDGNTALHDLLDRQIATLRVPLLDAMLSAGADLSLRNNKGETVLHKIHGKHDDEVITKLVEAGADLEARDSEGRTPTFKFCTVIDFLLLPGDYAIPQTFVDLGAMIDTRDHKGMTLLHHCVGNFAKFRHLIDVYGLDCTAVDYKGNSLFFPVVSAGKMAKKQDVLRNLISLGLDIDQPNFSGKTVLHKLCSRRSRNLDSRHIAEEDQLFSYTLSLCKNVSARDKSGIQPLHLAATVSESDVFEILNAGADLFGVTNEGMSVLHFAAREQQPNIVGLVLARLSAAGETRLKEFINQQNVDGYTALHYACQSGRPETVRALLEFGADVKLPAKNGHTPFRECARFEAELLRHRRISKDWKKNENDKLCDLLATRSRPCIDEAGLDNLEVRWGSGSLEEEIDTARLDEILDMLVIHGAITDENEAFHDAIHFASSNRYDYTVDCLIRLQARVPQIVKGNQVNRPAVIAALSRVERLKKLAREDFPELKRIEVLGLISRPGLPTQPEYRDYFSEEMKKNPLSETEIAHHTRHCGLVHLLGLRQYEIFTEKVQEADLLEINRLTTPIAYILVKFGLTEVFDRVCSGHAAKKFDDDEWCLQTPKAKGCRVVLQPLLITACNRQLPNLDMLKLLVEKKGVEVNARHRISPGYGILAELGGSALHELVKRRTWWSVNQAIPYMIKMGADIELRNENGETPLHLALNGTLRRQPELYKDAVRILVHSGANVNAVDNTGKTCLSKIGNNLELLHLFLSHGAEISAKDIFAAIEIGEVEVLKILLCNGKYANIKRTTSTGFKSRTSGPIIADNGVSPLLYAAEYTESKRTFNTRQPARNDFQELSCRIEMMRALLDNGADPYATFIVAVRAEGKTPVHNKKQRTVIHEILRKGKYYPGPFLELHSLRLEYRDAKGRTLLLAASERPENYTPSSPSSFSTRDLMMELIDRGADVLAQDHDGRTILHNIVKNKMNWGIRDMVQFLLNKEPSLVHIADTAGNTPLHHTLSKGLEYVDLFLENGANPLQPDSDGNTALHAYAANASDLIDFVARFEQFKNAGLDINIRNKMGETPLFAYVQHFGERFSQKQITSGVPKLKFLEDSGAELYTCDNAGTSLLHLLASKSDRRSEFREVYPVLFKYLMERGLDHMREDAQSRTSLDVAVACGNEPILKLFERKRLRVE